MIGRTAQIGEQRQQPGPSGSRPAPDLDASGNFDDMGDDL